MTPEEAIVLHDFLDVAAKRYPIKALAEDINKAESSLRNELVHQSGYKLGVVTAIEIMEKTGDLSAMDWIERRFDRVAVRIPTSAPTREEDLVTYAGRIARETGDVLVNLGAALADGRMTAEERHKIREETYEALRAIGALWVKIGLRGMPVRKLTDHEKALWLTIELNKRTIRQLQVANQHLTDLLPKIRYFHQGAVEDPRTGDDREYQKKRKKDKKT